MNAPMDVASTITSESRLSDQAGIIASLACAVHCAAMPLVLGYLPMLGLDWLADESFHRVMALVCFALAVSAFVPGWRRHRSFVPAAIGAAGLSLIGTAAFALEGECCPTCAPETTAAASTCGDDSCTACPEQVESATAAQTDPLTLAGIGTWAIPLVTPLGGGLLVAGHLVNHRKSCGCGADHCCHDSTEHPTAD